MDKQISGLDCVELANGALSLLIPRAVGPRILSLRVAGKQNLLAELPDVVLDCDEKRRLTLWGGHRLWHAPEVPARTYLPDDRRVDIRPNPATNALTITQAADASQLEKTLTITLPDDSATVIIDHTLTNRGLWPITCAAWAITQLRTGGTAILPQHDQFVDEGGFQANRALALWPYSDINSPFVQWGNRFIFYRAAMQAGAWKVGFPNPVGWLGYWIDGQLFMKSAEYDPTASYYDNQSSSQCYCNQAFIELETLSPQVTITPQASITHRETWHIFNNVPFEPDEEVVAALIEQLNFP